MPSEEEVLKLWDKYMENIGYGKDFKHPTSQLNQAMANISIENKWMLVHQAQTVEVRFASCLSTVSYLQ
jgi:hypothetical protein